MTKNCEHCRKEYTARRFSQRYCSLDCRYQNDKARRRAQSAARPGRRKNCKICNKRFTSEGNGRKYCSPQCSQAACLAKTRERTGYQPPTPRPCHECGTTFTPRQGSARYCSRACGQRAHNKRTPKPQPRRYSATHTCKHCTKPFQASTKNSSYCSPSCHRAWAKANRLAWYGAPRPETRLCKTCHKPFTTHHSSQLFCSPHCRGCGQIKGKAFSTTLGTVSTGLRNEQRASADLIDLGFIVYANITGRGPDRVIEDALGLRKVEIKTQPAAHINKYNLCPAVPAHYAEIAGLVNPDKTVWFDTTSRKLIELRPRTAD